MNLKRLGHILMLGLFASGFALQAQEDKQYLTLSQYTAGSPEYLYPKRLVGLQWMGVGFLFVDGDKLMYGVPNSKMANRPLLDLQMLEKIISEGKVEESLRKFPPYKVLEGEKPLLELTLKGKIYLIDPFASRLEATFHLPKEGRVQAHSLSPDRKHLAYVQDHNLYVLKEGAPASESEQITHDGSPTLVYGQIVHQNEFGIDRGLFWSPEGGRLAYYRMDQSMVSPYPILHVDARRPYAEESYYPMAGTASHEVTLHVYDLGTKRSLQIQAGDPKDRFFTNVAWAPDGKTIYMAEVNRAQTESKLQSYSAETGTHRALLFEESNEKYIEPQHPMNFVPGSDDLFVWQSRRDGWMHLYLYNTKGKLIKQITKGNWEVVDFKGFSADGQRLFYTSTEASPLERQLYSIGLKGGQSTRLTEEAGWHSVKMSADRHYFIDELQSGSIAYRASLRDTGFGASSRRATTASNARERKRLLDAPNPDDEFLTPRVELGVLKAADGKTDLHYRLIRPHDFDPKKKYPAIIYVYNGPHAQLVQNRFRFGAGGWDLHMANKGYVVLTVDGRGSAYRGVAFEQVIHRRLGEHEMADQMQGVEMLRSKEWIDSSRIGVYGWSYGGFMTTNLMLTHPEVFKVGVAGGPVMDWARYEIMYGERYMQSPQKNPEGYKSANLIDRAGDLKGRLLIIHGTIDPVVIWQHSLLFVQSAVTHGTYPDYMVYPEHQHNVLGPDRVHLNETITRYFLDHL